MCTCSKQPQATTAEPASSPPADLFSARKRREVDSAVVQRQAAAPGGPRQARLDHDLGAVAVHAPTERLGQRRPGFPGALEERRERLSDPRPTAARREDRRPALAAIQTKLAVNAPGDAFEQEADRVADAVVAGQSPAIRGKVQNGRAALARQIARPEDLVDSVAPPSGLLPAVETPADDEETVQRSAAEPATVTPRFEHSLQQTAGGGGRTLPAPTRAQMEGSLGWDFSAVRVHSGTRAHELATEVNAEAFTLGQDIFFARGRFDPEHREGQRLLAHELTHVVQQTSGRLARKIQRKTKCSAYPGYDSSKDLKTYNCAGLALRTYQYTYPPSKVYDEINANFTNPRSPQSGSCPFGVTFWLWQYDLAAEDDKGKALSSASRDFHIVAGTDPSMVLSKNGARKVYGPAAGPSFKPPARERALSNDPSETPVTTPDGRPVFKVRSNYSEELTCADCET
jgi:hypothetical protein